MSAAKDIARGLRAIVSHESVRLGGRAMTIEADCDHSDQQEICGACGVPRDQDYGCARCGD
jgi:hypothetical protein